MTQELPFETWYEEFKIAVSAAGLPPLEEEFAVLTHMEGLSVEDAIAQYKKETD